MRRQSEVACGSQEEMIKKVQLTMEYHLADASAAVPVDAAYYSRVLGDESLPGGEAVKLIGGREIIDAMNSLQSNQPEALLVKETQSLLATVMDSLGLFLFPCPMYSSPLRILLDPTSTVLSSSHQTLKIMCIAERKAFHGSVGISLERKKVVEATRDKFLARIAMFARAEGGLHRVFLLPQDNVATDAAFLVCCFPCCA